MTKTEMAEKLAKQCDLSKAKALDVIACIFDTAPGKGANGRVVAEGLIHGKQFQVSAPDQLR